MAKIKSLNYRVEEVINELDDVRSLSMYLSECSFDALRYIGGPYRCIARLVLQSLLQLSDIHQELEDKNSN